jgi:hypothetical protein
MTTTSGVSIAGRLLERFHFRFPTLVAILAALTLADLAIPDMIPFIDEIGLALLTLLFGMWRNRKTPDQPVDAGGSASPESARIEPRL